jgi:zinc D-Ala-D-Ala carboxypeptidase
MTMNLTKDITLEELVRSDTATRLGIKNIPSSDMIEKLRDLAVHCLQPIQDHFGKEVIISSGFRCVALNSKIKGAVKSQHIRGEAADFIIKGVNLKDIFNFAVKNLEFDQLIYEFDSWIHISYSSTKNRKQAMRAYKKNGSTVYENINAI